MSVSVNTRYMVSTLSLTRVCIH